MKVLVVDDDNDFTSKQCAWLEKEGYDAVGVNWEREARNYLAENGEHITIALIDMYMEEEDSGLKLIRLIKKSYPWIVPVVITGRANFGDAARCMEEGCFSYIVKGETPPDMIRQIIRKVVEHHRFLTILPRLKSGAEELRVQLAELDKQMERTSCSLQRFEDEFPLLSSQNVSVVSGSDEEKSCDDK